MFENQIARPLDFKNSPKKVGNFIEKLLDSRQSFVTIHVDQELSFSSMKNFRMSKITYF